MMELPYVWRFLCAGMMRTELGGGIEYCGVFWVLSYDVSQGVKRVKDICGPSVPRSIYHRVNNLNPIYTLGNVTRRNPKCTT
jgi:hypothetical protein